MKNVEMVWITYCVIANWQLRNTPWDSWVRPPLTSNRTTSIKIGGRKKSLGPAPTIFVIHNSETHANLLCIFSTAGDRTEGRGGWGGGGRVRNGGLWEKIGRGKGEDTHV